jgi:hypothetical protein
VAGSAVGAAVRSTVMRLIWWEDEAMKTFSTLMTVAVAATDFICRLERWRRGCSPLVKSIGTSFAIADQRRAVTSDPGTGSRTDLGVFLEGWATWFIGRSSYPRLSSVSDGMRQSIFSALRRRRLTFEPARVVRAAAEQKLVTECPTCIPAK